MANILQSLELDGLREDFSELLGDGSIGGDGSAKMTVAITRVATGTGTVDPTTLAITPGSVDVIYTGEAYINPIIFRRDRQELAGGEDQRIRQYRGILPWDSGDIRIDDKIQVLTSVDPQFANRTMTISDVMYEAELAVRRITITDLGESDTGENC